MSKFVLDRDRFDSLVHYIIAMCPDPAKLGSTKLQKILWKSDTRTYMLERRPITGAKYRKREYGPATDEFWRSCERLSEKGLIKYWRDEAFAPGRKKDVYQSLANPNVGFLTNAQRKTVDHWIDEICLRHTAKSISDETHGYAWEIAQMGEELPLYSVFVDDLPHEPDEKARTWAEAEIKRLGIGAL
jgi:hypothetical protein